MIDRIDWNDTPDSDVVPTDAYHCTVSKFDWEYSQNGKLMGHLTLHVDAPSAYKGAFLHNRFVIGSDDDPGGDEPDTWKRRAGQDLKKCLAAVFGDVASLSGNPATDVAAAIGYPVGCIINLETDNRAEVDGQPNPYYGREQNRFRKWFNVQDADAPQPGTMPVAGARPAAGRPATRPAPTPRQPNLPPVGALVNGPVPAQRTAPARPPMPARPGTRPAPPPPRAA